MTKYIFKFPRVDAESIVVDADGFGDATEKAVAKRIANVTPTRVDGEIYEQKQSLVNPGTKKEA